MSQGEFLISNVLMELIKRSGISESELARQIKVPRGTINRLVLGRTPDPRASTLNAIAEYFGVSVDQLIGKQPLLVNEHSVVSGSQSFIPILNLKETQNWEEVIKSLKPEGNFEWILIDPSIEQGRFAIRLNGESMWPQFQENTILIIAPEQIAKNRDYVVAYVKSNDEIVFRQLVIDGKYKFLKAINSIFPAIPFGETDKIIGVVIQTRNNL